MWGIEHEDGIVPDIMSVGKGFGGGFPMSGLLIRDEVAFAKPWANPSGSSSSYGGNPMAAAAARVTLETIHRGRARRQLATRRRKDDGRGAAVGARDSDRQGCARPWSHDRLRHRGSPARDTLLDKKITRQIFDALSLARRAVDDLQSGSAHQSAARDLRGAGDGCAGDHEGRVARDGSEIACAVETPSPTSTARHWRADPTDVGAETCPGAARSIGAR